MPELWIFSVFVNAALAAAALILGIVLTKGAGFRCPLAFIRWLQRLAFMTLAFALLANAVHYIEIREPPSLQAFMTQLAFMAVLATSAVRHLWAPPIPLGTTWRHRPF